MHRSLTTPALVVAGVTLAACGGATTDDQAVGASPSASAQVVATTTVLGDVVGRVAACGGADVTTLLPIGADPHDFSPSSEQVATVVNADLVVANGLGLEEGLADALTSAASDGATVMEVAEMVDPLPFGDEHGDGDEEHEDDSHGADEHSEGDGEDHDHGDLDPHFWHDVARMATAAELIGAELAATTGDDAYSTCGTQVANELRATDAQVRDILAAVPADQRVMVTDHEAFGYFADAYDFEIAGVVIPGGATLAEPSSRELAALVDVIVDREVPAVFSNTNSTSALVDAVAAESGSQVEVVPLYVEGVGPDGSGAETYADMMTTNAQRVADALTSS